jgi:hypothetical protein
MGTVQIGDQTLVVEEPSIRKAELIGDELAALGKDAPEIQIELAKFVARYEKENKVTFDRGAALSQMPHRVEHFSEQDWKACGNHITLSRSPTGTEQILAILPTVFTKAKEQALDVVSLLMIPNDDFEDEVALEKACKDNKHMLRYKAKPSQLIALLSECTELVREVLEQNKEALGKLRSFWTMLTRPEAEPTSEHEAALEEVERELSVIGGSPASTSSPTDTGGDSERSSTESPSETLSSSSV